MTKDEALSAKHEGATTVALKLALEALGHFEKAGLATLKTIDAITAIREALAQPEQSQVEEILRYEIDALEAKLAECRAQSQQEPVAYDKTELNCFAQDLYDQKMREGKRGHYESMFHVIHQCIKKVAPQPEQPNDFNPDWEAMAVMVEEQQRMAKRIEELEAQPDVDRRSTESKETFDQQEPVAITITGKLGNIYSFTGDYSLKKGDKVYTTPPSNSMNSIKSSNTLDAQRTWQGLTDEEIDTILKRGDVAEHDAWNGRWYVLPYSFAQSIEAKIKEKNT